MTKQQRRVGATREMRSSETNLDDLSTSYKSLLTDKEHKTTRATNSPSIYVLLQRLIHERKADDDWRTGPFHFPKTTHNAGSIVDRLVNHRQMRMFLNAQAYLPWDTYQVAISLGAWSIYTTRDEFRRREMSKASAILLDQERVALLDQGMNQWKNTANLVKTIVLEMHRPDRLTIRQMKSSHLEQAALQNAPIF